MSEFDKLAKQFEEYLDSNLAIPKTDLEAEGMELIKDIEAKMNKLNYQVPVLLHERYQAAIDRNVWDKRLVDELQEVKSLLAIVE